MRLAYFRISNEGIQVCIRYMRLLLPWFTLLLILELALLWYLTYDPDLTPEQIGAWLKWL